MKYRYVGSSGLAVSRVCLGVMTFGQSDWGCDEAEAKRIFAAFVNAGGNYVDTADVYAEGRSEQILGACLRAHRRESLVIASKCLFPVSGGPNGRGLSRKHIIEACEASLKRLGTDYIDLYQIHGPDPVTPLEETLRALDDLVRHGKVLYLGCSNLYAWQFVKANGIAERLGLSRFVCGQYLYNLISRDVEREVLDACVDQGMGFVCWSPLAAGLLTGKYPRADAPEAGTRMARRARYELPRYWHERGFSVAEALVRTAAEVRQPPHLVALAWLLGDPRVTSVIVGARTEQQILQNQMAGDWDLDSEHRNELDRAAAADRGYPHSWISMNATPQFADVES